MASSRETDKTDENDDDASDAPQSLHPTPKPPEPLLIGQCSGFIETTVKIKQNEMLPGPKVCLHNKKIKKTEWEYFLDVHDSSKSVRSNDQIIRLHHA